MATTTSQAPQLFSGGIEMASLMLSTGILQKGWESISELLQLPNLTFSMKTLTKASMFTFSSTCRHQPQGSESILRKLDTADPLSFLITKDNKDISLCKSSLSTFDSLLQNESLKQQQHRDLLGAMEEREKDEFVRKKSAPNPSKRLNEVKKQMAMLEWYMKWCEENNMVYYECFKSRSTEKDIDVIKFKNILAKYWKEMVEKSESEPQTPDVPMRDRWLFSGTNYRRIAEPLDIAEYYKKPKNRDYMNKGRSQHYKVLEAWQKEADRPKVKDKAPSLTEDSCFWAKVEEARINLEELKKPDSNQDELRRDLKTFEHYVIELIRNRELSRKVFTIPNNLFLTWWEGYKEFYGQDYNSSLGSVIDDPSQYQ